MEFLNSPIIEITLSLIVSWALFAVLCSFAHELISELLGERGRFLKKYLYKQLEDKGNGVNWASTFYMHGSIDLLTRAENKPTSFIPPKLFAEALIEIVGNANIVQQYIQTQPDVDDKSPEAETHRQFLKNYAVIAYQSPVMKHFKAATMVMKPSDVVTLYKQSLSTAELRAGVAPGDPNALKAYETLVYNNLVENICNWYDSFSMRTNLWYKKITRRRLFILGILFAVALHVDTLELFTFYRDNGTARKSVVTYFKEHELELEEQYRALHDTTNRDYKKVYNAGKDFTVKLDSITKANAIPVGWQYYKDTPGDPWHVWVLRILGFILTAFAGSLGAPFWFDTFKRITKANLSKP
jgi:hypothetical protein